METSRFAPLPPWLKTRVPSGSHYERIKALSSSRGLNTVCEEARCPNLSECWGGGTATFMILGDTCTRGCRFCSVSTALHPKDPDPNEPLHIAESLRTLDLQYAVITTVCRDDLEDQGAGHIARCLQEIRSLNPKLLIEILMQDFRGDLNLIRRVAESGADVLAHNIETVERLSPKVRDAKAGYRQSLTVLKDLKALRPDVRTKSSLMLGLGESEAELRQTFSDLREAGVEILTLGQYLRPARHPRHLPVENFISPSEFDRYGRLAREQGFLYVASGPFVRSSYRAGELFLRSLSGRKAAENLPKTDRSVLSATPMESHAP